MSCPGGAHNAGRDRPCFRLILVLLAFLTMVSGAQAQPSSPRAAVHDDYVRIVFDWDAPVGYSAEIVNGQLLVRFDRPIKGNVQSLSKPLAKIAHGVSVSDDGLAATFALVRPMAVKAFVGNNNSVVIDLTAAPAGETPGAAAQPSASGPAVVDARAGDHGTYTRLVFDWPGPVGYSAEKQGGRATISFTKPGRIDLPILKSGLPSDITASLADGGKGLGVVLQVPPDTRLRHFTSGNKVVVDVVRATDATAPEDSAKVPLAPAPGADVAQPAIKPLAPEGEAPKTPEETLKNGLTPVKPTPSFAKASEGKPAATAMTAPSAPAPPATAPAVPEAPPPATPVKPPPGPVYSLSVPMTKPSAAAVFQRAGYLWIVLDRRTEVDTALLRRLGGESVLAVEQIPNKDATVLRLVVKPGFYPSMRKEGVLWIVDLTDQPSRPKDIIPVVAPANLPGGVGMSVKAPDSGSLISIIDPEIGDMMKVVPVIPVGQGVYPGRDAPDLELLDTTQGIVIVPHVDGLDIRSTRGGVTIGTFNGSGLRFSSELDTAPKDAATTASNALFDVASWKRGGPDNFEANRQIVQATLASVSTSKRALAHLQAARFFLANGYPAETLGYLRLAAVDQPDLADTPGFKAVKGAAEALLAQWDLAQADLDMPALANDPESQMWRAYAHIGNSDTPGQWDRPMAAGLNLLKGYPHRLKWRLAAAAVTAGVAAGDDQAANLALSLLDREEATKMEEPERDYLHGTYDQMVGHFDKAIDEYDNAAESDNREFRALARFAETELQLRTHKIKPKEAADQLDKLRFSWREESFEFNLLLRYAQLQQQAGDYPSSLRALRSLVNYYPDDKDAPKAVQMMSDMFKMLYLQGGADTLSPISAIGLFDEFRDLTPTGAEGDEMIRKLADRLAKVDLLDRAAELLKHQVTYRLSGVDKARVGAQLAVLDLMNQQPQAALDGLAASEVDGQPDELKRQRRHLKARAFSDLDRVPDAIHALDGDNSPEAAQLRSEIHWKAQDWPGAAADFEAMVPRPDRGAKLDDQQAKTCLSWATALVLANDERGLAGLRRNYGPAMSGTPYAEGFSLLTSALDRETPNMPEIASKIKEVEGFKGFLSDYRKRMQDGGISAIN
jgi:tetratricopeptide (TPR) repeat protein